MDVNVRVRVCVGVRVCVDVSVGVCVGVEVNVWVGVDVLVGVGVDVNVGTGGQFKIKSQTVPSKGAVTTTVTVDGDGDVYLVGSKSNVTPYLIGDSVTIGEDNGIYGSIKDVYYFDKKKTPDSIQFLYNLTKNKNAV